MQINICIPASRERVGKTNGHPVLVCGAGAAGIAAALTAARSGAEVWLIEPRERIGGTVVHALIHTLGGFFDADGELIDHGLPAELVDTLKRASPLVDKRKMGRTWVLVVPPEVYRDVAERMVAQEPRIRLLTCSRVTAGECHEGRVIGATLLNRAEAVHLAPLAVIDTTGTGEFVRRLNPDLVDDDHRRAAGGLIFRMRGVKQGAIDFPNGVTLLRALHEAVADGRIPESCQHAWIDRGVFDDEVYVKLFLTSPTRFDGQENTQAAVLDFLSQQPGFESARVYSTGQIGIRDGGRVRGEYELTASDVRRGARFDDAACRGSWPIEYWDPARGLSLEYLPRNCTYDIPLRALRVKGLHNVWVAGKCLSADREAQASARVVGTCWAMGEAAGKAAAAAQSLAGELSYQR
jgi:FAD-dependent oxidoreductase family protein